MNSRRSPLKVSFSDRALVRASKRVQLSVPEITELLNSGRTVLLGNPMRTRNRRLFWSEPDQHWFIAILHRESGVVVTILHFAHYFRKVRVNQLLRAKDLALGKISPLADKKRVELSTLMKRKPVAVKELKRVLLPSELQKISDTAKRPRFGARFEDLHSNWRVANLGRLNFEAKIEDGVPEEKAREALLEKIHNATRSEERCVAIVMYTLGGGVTPIKLA